MTCDERIEALLNRAGQTISDLPQSYPSVTGLTIPTDNSNTVAVYPEVFDYILHLTDVIDRLEWALENVIGERDWLRFMLCEICDMESNGASCKSCNVKIGGVPEDWREDI